MATQPLPSWGLQSAEESIIMLHKPCRTPQGPPSVLSSVHQDLAASGSKVFREVFTAFRDLGQYV